MEKEKEIFLKNVSIELKVLRVSNNDTQEELSRKSGVATSTISKYETSTDNLNLDKIQEIIEPYNITLSIFFKRVIAKTQNS